MDVFSSVILFLMADAVWCCIMHKVSVNPRQAKSFLNRSKRSEDCREDGWCENHRDYCRKNFEDGREHYCANSPCPGGTTCYLSQPCYNPNHPIVTNCTTDICMSNPCKNGGDCYVVNGIYKCLCIPGYNQTTDCATENDECLSNPCLNDGVCNDKFNGFSCTCTKRFQGDICEKDCRPGPADIVFVIDTSSSIADDVNTSVNFINDLIMRIPVGPNDFQVGVITYSFEPEILFDLDDHSSKANISADLQSVAGQDGATITASALRKAAEMLRNGAMGARPPVHKYIILLSDGLSSDRLETVSTSISIIALGMNILTVGIGQSISYEEMLMVSGIEQHIFSPLHIEDLLNRLFVETVHTDCNDCILQKETDLLILLDTNNNQAKDGYNIRLKTIRKVIENVLSYNPNTRIGMMSYSDEPEHVFNLSWSKNRDDIIAAALKVAMDIQPSALNTSRALKHIRQLDLFSSPRKIILLLSNGNWSDLRDVKTEIDFLKKEGVNVLSTIAGEDCIMNSFSLAFIHPSQIYYVVDDDFTSLKSLASLTTYYNCTENIFSIRQ